MLLTIFQTNHAFKNRYFALVFLCFFISTNSFSQNLLATNNNPGFEGTGGFQANGYTNISPGTSGTSSLGNYAITGDSGPMNSSFKSVTPYSGTKMMVVDANNEIFWQGNPNIQLVGGVTYTFSYWVVNVNKNGTSNPAFPNPIIKFVAVDQCGCTPVLKKGSPTVNDGVWRQVVYEFTPSGTGAKWVRFELSTPGATPNGNDFAIDDISLYEPPKPITLSYTKSDSTCPSNNDGTIIGYSGWGVPPYTFKLTGPTVVPDNATGIFSGLKIGSYTLTVSDSQATPDSKTISPITLITPLDISVVSNAGTCNVSGSLVELTASNAGPIYTWKDSSSAVLGTGNPFSVNPIATSTYTVESTSTTIIPPSNLITNGDFESGNTGFKSDYGFYSDNTSGAQKAYGIQSDPSVSFTTFEKCGDNTNGLGLMMVVDGAVDGTSVVWSQIVHVENNTNYDFSFYVQNLTPSNKATFSLSIGGTPITLTSLSAINSGSAAPVGCGWTQIKGTWTSGLVTPNPEIKIVNTKTNSAGNDFSIDDITFIAQTSTSKTCNLSKDITVTINPLLAPTIDCGTSTTSSVQFTWAAVSNATDYSVSYTINASPSVIIGSIGNVLTYTVNSLTSGDNVTITVTPIGGSGTCFTSNTLMCTASNCISPTATISYASSPFCLSNTTPQPVTLIGTGAYTTGTYSAVGLTINPLTGSITPSANTSGSYTVTYIIPASGGCSQVKTTTPITISPQPDSGTDGGISVCENDTASINLFNLITGEQSGGVWTRTTGVGGNLNAGVGIFTSASGATTSTFTYTLDNSPCKDSSIATVTINPLPVLTITCGTTTGTSVTFNWNSIADATSYSYSYSINSGAAVTGVLSAATTSYTVNGLTPGQNVSIILTTTGSVCGKQAIFNCVSSNCPTPIVDVISNFPSCANENVTIPTFTSSTSGVTFNWTNTNTSIGIAASGFGETIPTFNVINTTAILQSATISVTANDGTCTGPAMVFNLDVNPLPTVTISATKNSVCSGSATTINFNGTPNASVTYTVNSGANQFLVLDPSGNATLPTGNLITSAVYNLISVSDITTTCSQLQTGKATININAAPDVVPATITQSVCSGQSSGVLLTSTTSGTIFNWTVIESGVTGATLGTGNNISQVLNSISPINVGTAEYTVTPTTNGCSGLPVVITVSVSPTPTAVATPDKEVICSGATTAIALSSGNTQTTFSWNAIQNNVTGATQDSGNKIIQVLQTSLNNFGEAVYAITPSLNGCIGSTILVPITVNPVPIVSTNVFNNPICSGTATNIELTSNVPGTTFTWSVAQINVIGAVPGNGNAIAQIIETTGTSLGIVAYTVTPQINSCIGNPVIVPIQVNPTPEVFAPSSTTICSGDSPNISLIPLIIGTSFSWTDLPDKVMGSSSGNTNVINQILITENNSGKVEYTVTPELGLCMGTSRVITVFVNPSPILNLENGVLCLEVDGTLKKILILDTNLSTNSYDFEWFFNNSISPISGATGSSFEAKELGDYSVNLRFTSTGCSIKSNTSTVTEVNPTNSFDVIVSDAFTENASITVTGQNAITTYLYQIDDGALQVSNVFNGLGAGTYTIRVTDADGCTDYSEPVLAIDYPKYFTPNGDGINDTWNIKGLSDQNNTKLLIYDRYGKLLKQISPKGQGWDGTFNGVQLPAADYWFTVNYVEPNNNLNKLFKAHFSLKR